VARARRGSLESKSEFWEKDKDSGCERENDMRGMKGERKPGVTRSGDNMTIADV